MECGFYRENKECTEECRYFETCTRNPHRKDGKDGRSEVDQDNNGCI